MSSSSVYPHDHGRLPAEPSFPKNKIENPTVGRIVHFYEPGRTEPWPAVVVAVPDDQRPLFPHLAVFRLDDIGLERDAPHHSCSDAGRAVAYWDWMPFQKGQAAKTEALQRELDAKVEKPTQPHERLGNNR